MTDRVEKSDREIAQERAENFCKTFHLDNEIKLHLENSYEAHGRLARRQERLHIVDQLDKWGCPHDGIDFDWILNNLRIESDRQ